MVFPGSIFDLFSYYFVILYASRRIWSQGFIINCMLMISQCLCGDLAVYNQSVRFSSCLLPQASHLCIFCLHLKRKKGPISNFFLYLLILVGCLRTQLLTSNMQFVTRSYLSFPIHSYCLTILLACIISPCGLYTRLLALVYSLSSLPLVRVVFLLPFSFLRLLPSK